MIRLHVVVEGQTEEEFVNSVLANHFGQFDISTDARCILTSRSRRGTHRGGISSYAKTKRDVELWLKEDNNRDSCVTTMFDLYGLPTDFPGFPEAAGRHDPRKRVESIEASFAKDINHNRFIPYIQLHEFEAFLFVDPAELSSEFLDHAAAIQNLIDATRSFESPELIDDHPSTAPSKRIIAVIPEYEGRKVSAGPRIARRIGLPSIRQKCPHFDGWLSRIEALR